MKSMQSATNSSGTDSVQAFIRINRLRILSKLMETNSSSILIQQARINHVGLNQPELDDIARKIVPEAIKSGKYAKEDMIKRMLDYIKGNGCNFQKSKDNFFDGVLEGNAYANGSIRGMIRVYVYRTASFADIYDESLKTVQND